MGKTKIEWVKNPDGSQGYTWNPITGCLNGCSYCYARRLANGRLKHRYLANKNYPVYATSGMRLKLFTDPTTDPFYPRFWPERLEDIKRPPPPSAWANNAPMDRPWELQTFVNRHAKRKARGIFTCDMADLFGIGVPEEWTREVLGAIRYNSVDRFYLLTHQPQELQKWSPFPPNCFVGVTATAPEGYKRALAGLAVIEARVKYLSIEPFLERIRMSPPYELSRDDVQWLIIGTCTGTMKDLLPLHHKTNLAMIKWGNKWTLQPEKESVKEIVHAADKAHIPVFQKNNLKPLLGEQLRQELPQ